MKKALFVLRAQPLHKGHLHAIKEALKRFDFLTIGIGSSQFKNTADNPFSFEERRKMVRKSLVGEKRYKIIPVPDFFNAKKWAGYLMARADFDVVITGNPWTERCFRGKMEIERPAFLLPKWYNATRIRERMAKGQKWGHLVPEGALEVLRKIDGDRIKSLRKKS